MYLKNTYRLGRKVVDASQKLIDSDENYRQFRREYYPDYKLEPQNKKENHPVIVQEFQDQHSEVRWVVEQIYKHLDNGYEMRDITILIREFKLTSFYDKLKYEIERMKEVTGKEIRYEYVGPGADKDSR
jgi:superfamily I DNA/RNA helicase